MNDGKKQKRVKIVVTGDSMINGVRENMTV